MAPSETKLRSSHFVQLVHIMYAVVIGLSFQNLADNLRLPIATSNFLKPPFAFFCFSLFLAVRDWANYNNSVSTRPHKTPTRFALDILILISFFFLLETATGSESLTEVEIARFCTILAVYFGLTMLWEVSAYLEYRSDDADSEVPSELHWNIAFAIAFGLLAIVSMIWNALWPALISFVAFAVVSLLRKEFG